MCSCHWKAVQSLGTVCETFLAVGPHEEARFLVVGAGEDCTQGLHLAAGPAPNSSERLKLLSLGGTAK